jgi:hypothetical protein
MQLTHDHPYFGESKIGLSSMQVPPVKLGSTCFSCAKPLTLCAPVLLDRINLVDLPAFFFARDQAPESIQQWLEENGFAELANASGPLNFYHLLSTGGN